MLRLEYKNDNQPSHKLDIWVIFQIEKPNQKYEIELFCSICASSVKIKTNLPFLKKILIRSFQRGGFIFSWFNNNDWKGYHKTYNLLKQSKLLNTKLIVKIYEDLKII